MAETPADTTGYGLDLFLPSPYGYHDLVDVITEWEKYHQEYMQKAQSVKNLIRGIQQPNSRKHNNLDSLD